MNKEELIAKIEERAEVYHGREDLLSAYVKEALEDVLDLARNLEEPEGTHKQFVPKEVANMLEEWNGFGVDSHSVMVTYHDWYYSLEGEYIPSSTVTWALANPTAFMKAWVNGYEVKKEPLYRVKIKLDRNYHLAIDEGDGNEEIITTLTTVDDVFGYRYELTEKEIKSAGDNLWAFAVPVEEVAEG